MLNDLFRQLNDFDPAVRRAAIIALGKSKDASALRALAEVVRNDSDPELRDLARKAGLYIRKETGADPTPTPATPAQPITPTMDPPPEMKSSRRRGMVFMDQEGSAEAAPVLPAKPVEPTYARKLAAPVFMAPDEKPVNKDEEQPRPVDGRGPVRGIKYRVPPEARERARQYTQDALTDTEAGRKARAMKYLTEALSLDPNLINDGYFGNVAGVVTGLSDEEALQSIVNPKEREKFVSDANVAAKKKKVDTHLTTVRATRAADFWFEMFLFVLIVTIGPVLIALIGVQALNGYLTGAIAAATEAGQRIPRDVRDLQAGVAAIGFFTLLPISIFTLITALISLFVQMGLVHFIATIFLRGKSTFRHLITMLLSHYNRWVPLVFGMILITILIAGATGPTPLLFCPNIILVFLTMYVFGKTSSKVGEAYGFGGAMGCVAVMLATFVLIILNIGVSFAAAQATGLVLDQVLSGMSITPP